MQTPYPNPLPSLTIDVLCLLADPSVSARISPKLLEEAQIVSSHLAPQSLECAVVLRTGEVAVFRIASVPSGDTALPKTLDDAELISASHVSTGPNYRFQPLFVINAGRGSVTALSISDIGNYPTTFPDVTYSHACIGFLAVAFRDGSIFVIDMRGPRIILREVSDKQSHRRSLLHRHEVDTAVSLTWTVAGTDAGMNSSLAKARSEIYCASIDIFPRVRLIATRGSGNTTIHALSRSSSGAWAVSEHRETTEGISHAIPRASFVLDAKNGAHRKADRSGLAEVIHSDAEDARKGTSFWVTAGAKGAKCAVDITGERIGRAEWPSKTGKVERVVVIKKNSEHMRAVVSDRIHVMRVASTMLVAYTDKREALVYSLPYLEHMHSLQLPQSSNECVSLPSQLFL
jgi:syntaxin-binding protein 5